MRTFHRRSAVRVAGFCLTPSSTPNSRCRVISLGLDAITKFRDIVLWVGEVYLRLCLGVACFSIPAPPVISLDFRVGTDLSTTLSCLNDVCSTEVNVGVKKMAAIKVFVSITTILIIIFLVGFRDMLKTGRESSVLSQAQNL